MFPAGVGDAINCFLFLLLEQPATAACAFMNESKNPTDIAREALKRLAVRHLPPTPANFQSCYNEIAGLPDLPPFAEAPLRQLAATSCRAVRRRRPSSTISAGPSCNAAGRA
jgi:hypothetical protein